MINAFAGILFIVLIGTILHFLFSHLGFNPTDDGWILAGSRRIIEGQIPHRDFIFFHTSGSLFIHAPFVLFGGDYAFLISRYFVWLQLTSIAWIWTAIITRSFGVLQGLAEKFAAALVALSFTAHYFPIMAWYTIDGLFLVSLGILICEKESKTAKMVGYMLIGAAPVCKQVFLPMILIALLLFNDWRELVFWVMASIPLAAYSFYLAIYGAIPAALLQLTIYSSFLSFGILPFASNSSVLWGIVFGSLAAYLLNSSFNPKYRSNIIFILRFIGVLIIFGIILFAAWTLARGVYTHIVFINILGRVRVNLSFVVFGTVSGEMIYFISREQKMTDYLRYGILIVFIAWCTSLSFGYYTPALATGPLILFLIASTKFSRPSKREDDILNPNKNMIIGWFLSLNFQKIINGLIILSLISSLIAFGITRENHIYREQPASQLTYDLGDLLPGAKGIKTNENTYNYFIDLQDAKSIAKENEKLYCIIPDTAVNWVKDSQSNPLPSDWPTKYELGSKELLDRAIKVLEDNRGSIIIIVQKYEASRLSDGFIPLSDGYPIVNYVRSNFEKMEETLYFELYE